MVWICHILFIYSPVGGHLGCFYVLIITRHAVMNIHVQVFVLTYVYISSVYIPKGGIAGSYGNSIYSFLRNCQTVFKVMATFYITISNL